MRSYGQYCAVARSLDVIGDRWTLLIVRELLLRGPSRYTDIRDGLPGIATNLLADRLRDLEDAGVLAREVAPPPIASTLYSLTERGLELRPLVTELIRWGKPLMAEPSVAEEFRARWLGPAAETLLHDAAPHEPPVTLELRSGDESLQLEIGDGAVRTRGERRDSPDAVLSGDPHAIVLALFGGLEPGLLAEQGLSFEGDRAALERVRASA